MFEMGVDILAILTCWFLFVIKSIAFVHLYLLSPPVVFCIYIFASRTLTFNSAPDHREKLEEELAIIDNMEMWRAGKTVRKLRPENQLAEEQNGEAVA